MSNPKIKAFLAVFAGLLTAFAGIMLCEMLAGMMFPHPEGLDFNNKEALNAFMKTASFGMFFTILAGYLLGAFAGGFVANRMALGSGYRPAGLMGAGLAVMTLLNLKMMWHPVWFWVASLVGIVVFALLGGRLVAR